MRTCGGGKNSSTANAFSCVSTARAIVSPLCWYTTASPSGVSSGRTSHRVRVRPLPGIAMDRPCMPRASIRTGCQPRAKRHRHVGHSAPGAVRMQSRSRSELPFHIVRDPCHYPRIRLHHADPNAQGHRLVGRPVYAARPQHVPAQRLCSSVERVDEGCRDDCCPGRRTRFAADPSAASGHPAACAACGT